MYHDISIYFKSFSKNIPDDIYIKPETRNRLYKSIRNIISSNKQQISKFEAEKLINLINKKTKEIPEINLKETANKNTIS